MDNNYRVIYDFDDGDLKNYGVEIKADSWEQAQIIIDKLKLSDYVSNIGLIQPIYRNKRYY